VDVADPRDARVSTFYLLPQGVYRAQVVMPVPARGAGFLQRYERVAPSAGP
jgi:hypothetical protein